MNIIQVCPYDLSLPGGVQTHITHLSKHLENRNHKVLVIAPERKNPGFQQLVPSEVRYLTDSKRINIWGTSIDISLLKRNEKAAFREILFEFEPDIIHFHTIWNPFMQTQLLHMTGNKVKKVATFHDTPPDTGIGKYLGGNMMKLAAGFYFSRIDEIISVSESQASAMGVSAGSMPVNFRIIPNGIDNTIAGSFKKRAKTKGNFNLIFIGRLERRKGLPDLLEIFSRLTSDINNADLTLSVLGNGPLAGEAKNLVSKYNLRNVVFYPDVDDENKFQLLSQSDLLVAPALYGESFGIVLLEAMSMGVKVAGYGNVGYLNIGRKYGEENFPAPGDKKRLYDVIKRHITDPLSTDYLIEKGIGIAKEHDWTRIVPEIEQVYSN